MRKLIGAQIFAILIIGLCTAQDSRPLIEVNSAVDTSRITIGDRITYTLSIDHVDTMRVEKPGEGVHLGQFEIKDYKIYDPVKVDGRILEKFEYVISVFDTGTFVIPPFPIAYFPEDSLGDYKLIEASPVTINVESVIHDEEKQLRDVKPPIDIPYDYFLLFSVLSSIVLIGILVYVGYRFYLKRKETGYFIKSPEPPRPAHEVALEALEELLKKDLISSGMIKEYYIEISDIIRHYIEGRYFIPALEETSREIIKELEGQDISEKILVMAKDLLDLSDLVKFAKYKPSDDENNNVINWSKDFIEGTKVIFVPESESENLEDPESIEIENEEVTEK